MPSSPIFDYLGGFDARTRERANEALSEIDELQSLNADLGAQVKKLTALARAQGQRLEHLELALGVVGQLLVEKKSVMPGEIEARIAEAVAKAAAQQQVQAQRVAEKKAQAAHLATEMARSQANAPTTCTRCGKTFPYHAGYMSGEGLICNECFQAQDG